MSEYPKSSKAVYMVSKILSLFSMEKEEIGVREVSQILGMSPASIYRLISSMEACGFLEKNANRKYQLGAGIYAIGVLYPFHSSLRKIVRPHAEDLAKTFRTNVQLAIHRKTCPDSAIIIDRITSLDDSSFHALRFHLTIPLYCTALGKAILSFLPLDEKKEVLQKMVLTRHTKSTITDIKVLKAEINQIQKDGFSIDRREILENLYCVGTPLFQNNKLVGALSFSDMAGRINEKNFREFAEILKEKATFISRQLLGAK
jgi:DNA-binding IclR family transcriptional regulator